MEIRKQGLDKMRVSVVNYSKLSIAVNGKSTERVFLRESGSLAESPGGKTVREVRPGAKNAPNE